MNIPFLKPELKTEFRLRITKVRTEMAAARLDAILVASTHNLFYLTGCVFRGYVYIPAVGDPLLFFIAPSQAPADTPYCMQIRKPEQIAEILNQLNMPQPQHIGLEFGDMIYADIERLKRCFPNADAADGTTPIRRARLVKTDFEIEQMRQDGMHQTAAYSRFRKCFREGMTDLEFQIEIERILRLEGCLGIVRTAGARMEINLGQVLTGENADNPSPYDFSMGGEGAHSSLPVGANGTILRPGMTVMVDMNGGFNGYQTDMTRCWALGQPAPLALKAHECSRRILRELERIGVPGTPAANLYNRAVEIATEEGLEKYFMGHQHKVAFIGHGIGVELNEAPVLMAKSRDLLAENMTIAIEPKFVIPNIGAVGIENTYRVTNSGLENLTKFPEDLNQLD